MLISPPSEHFTVHDFVNAFPPFMVSFEEPGLHGPAGAGTQGSTGGGFGILVHIPNVGILRKGILSLTVAIGLDSEDAILMGRTLNTANPGGTAPEHFICAVPTIISGMVWWFCDIV
ncbi:MAG: hypothetical protein ACI94Y_004017 [Maribacter sp.]|jgi:hypothetical protein